MKSTELPGDSELCHLLHDRYGDAIGAAGPPYISSDLNFGTKPEAPWLRAALFAVNDLRAEGATITDALRTVFRDHDINRVGGSQFGAFKRAYERFRKHGLRDHFYASILDGNLREAIAALRFCHDETRRAIWEDLNRDLSRRPPP